MEAAGSYLQEEIEWVRASITTPRPEAIILLPKERTDKLKREWKDDDPTVPPGWKVAWTTTSDNRSKIAFMSPDKKIFHSRKAALQHMMAAGTYDPEDIVKMTKGLNVLLNVGDEWKEGKLPLSPLVDSISPETLLARSLNRVPWQSCHLPRRERKQFRTIFQTLPALLSVELLLPVFGKRPSLVLAGWLTRRTDRRR